MASSSRTIDVGTATDRFLVHKRREGTELDMLALLRAPKHMQKFHDNPEALIRAAIWEYQNPEHMREFHERFTAEFVKTARTKKEAIVLTNTMISKVIEYDSNSIQLIMPTVPPYHLWADVMKAAELRENLRTTPSLDTST